VFSGGFHQDTDYKSQHCINKNKNFQQVTTECKAYSSNTKYSTGVQNYLAPDMVAEPDPDSEISVAEPEP
jgi:hypothetical protein